MIKTCKVDLILARDQLLSLWETPLKLLKTKTRLDGDGGDPDCSATTPTWTTTDQKHKFSVIFVCFKAIMTTENTFSGKLHIS